MMHIGQQPEAVVSWVGRASSLEQVGGRIDTKPGHPQPKPELHNLVYLVAHPRVGQIEVGLMLVEHMPIVLAGLFVPFPYAVFYGWKYRLKVACVIRV